MSAPVERRRAEMEVAAKDATPAPNTTIISLCERHNEPDTNLVDPYRLPPPLNLVHDLTGIFGVLLCQELAEPVPLVCHRNTVLWQVDIDCW